jgi:hypothetical protein
MNNNEWYDYEQQKAIALPPVGYEVEFKHKTDKIWSNRRTCRVIHFYGGKAWLHLDGLECSNIYHADSFDFRPLDHATRNADVEHKQFVDYVTNLLYKHCCATKAELRDGAEKLFELGFKLPEGQ